MTQPARLHEGTTVTGAPAKVAAALHALTRHQPKTQCCLWVGHYLQGQPVVPTAGHLLPIRALIWCESLHRRVPPGFRVVTTCRDPHCIAAKHLCIWPPKRIETRARTEDDSRDECANGHDLTDPAVALWSGGRRRCRLCRLEREQANRSESWTDPQHVRGPDGRFPVCRRGHLLSGDNVLYEGNGVRRCRTCRQASQGSTRRQAAYETSA